MGVRSVVIQTASSPPPGEPNRLLPKRIRTELNGKNQNVPIRKDSGPCAAQGAKRDVLVILLANALIIPLCKRAGLSAVLGFLAAGVVLGPNCLSIVSDVKAIEVRVARHTLMSWLTRAGFGS